MRPDVCPAVCLLCLLQVSKVWKVLAEDEVLWYRLCLKEGHLAGASVSDSPCWKGTLRDCRQMQDTLRSNWKVQDSLILNYSARQAHVFQ